MFLCRSASRILFIHHLQWSKQHLPKVHWKLIGNRNTKQDKRALISTTSKFLVPSLPTLASRDTNSMPLTYVDCMDRLAATVCFYGQALSMVFLFLPATTWPCHHSRVTKLNWGVWNNKNAKMSSNRSGAQHNMRSVICQSSSFCLLKSFGSMQQEIQQQYHHSVGWDMQQHLTRLWGFAAQRTLMIQLTLGQCFPSLSCLESIRSILTLSPTRHKRVIRQMK